jgi:hypothetical protein
VKDVAASRGVDDVHDQRGVMADAGTRIVGTAVPAAVGAAGDDDRRPVVLPERVDSLEWAFGAGPGQCGFSGQHQVVGDVEQFGDQRAGGPFHVDDHRNSGRPGGRRGPQTTGHPVSVQDQYPRCADQVQVEVSRQTHDGVVVERDEPLPVLADEHHRLDGRRIR